MTRFAFLAALGLTVAITSEPLAVGPRHPGGRHGGAARPAAPRPATPAFSRPQMSRQVARPMVPHAGFVPRRQAHVARPPATRPAPQTRPSALAGRPTTLRPNRPAATTPSIGPGPTAGPRIVNRPQTNRTTVNRPTYNAPTFNRNRTNNINRTNVDVRNRTNVDVRNRNVTRNTVIAGNRWGRGGRQVGAPRSWYSEPRNWGRSWWGGRPAWTWGRPWYWQHARWHHGFWNYWARPPAFWFGTGLAGGWLLSPGDTFAYFNPYYVAPVVGGPFFDYSVPLPAVPADLDAVALPPDPDDLADVDTPPPAPEVGLAADADRLLDDARASFRAGDYPKALELIDAAIKVTPSDPTLHEFRALTLFAQGNYQEAAAALYAVLTAGPGWDWATMREQYPDVATYTAQLRTLERFVADNPTLPYGHFVLAYHYLVTENKADAVHQLQEVVRLQPADKLSAALLSSLTNPAAAPDPTAPPVPGR